MTADFAISTQSLEVLLRKSTVGLGLPLTASQYSQMATHFALLLQWNRRMNLTSVREPEQIASRHFAESLFASTILHSPELFIDVGSGAGFPGLPLKVAWPSADGVLLEPSRKKAAFLREAIRQCALERTEVREERIEDAKEGDLREKAALVTMRAVKPSREVLAGMRKLLTSGGRAALFLGADDAAEIPATKAAGGFQWERPVGIPGSDRRVILIGRPELFR